MILLPPAALPSFNVNGTFAANTTHITFDRPGDYTCTVVITDGKYPVTESVSFTVAPQMSVLTIAPGNGGIPAGASQQFIASALDQFGRAIANPAVTWSLNGPGSISPAGLFTASASAGTSTTIIATAGALQASTILTVQQNQVPIVLTPAASSATNVTGTQANLSVLGSDDNGEAGLAYTWTATSSPFPQSVTFSSNGSNASKQTTATFAVAGNYTFLVTISDGALSDHQQRLRSRIADPEFHHGLARCQLFPESQSKPQPVRHGL